MDVRTRFVVIAMLAASLPALAGGPLATPQALEVQGTSLLGKPLVSAPPSAAAVENLERARAAYDLAPGDADALIWYGRRTAYTGNYKASIDLFTEGARKHPADPRFYRHRGHRHITLRQFDAAISDFERAAELMAGTPDAIEPDGMPNAKNIPVSTLHGNVWYHLGLAYYLENDLPNARRAFTECVRVRANDDGTVSATHWLYMILRRMGESDEAAAALESISPTMTIIENQAYHRLCLFYQGGLPLADLVSADDTGLMNDAVAYGVANWHLYNGRRAEARAGFEALLARGGWASFGFIAAEADWAREFK